MSLLKSSTDKINLKGSFLNKMWIIILNIKQGSLKDS